MELWMLFPITMVVLAVLLAVAIVRGGSKSNSGLATIATVNARRAKATLRDADDTTDNGD